MGCERLTYQIFSIFKDTPLKKRVSVKKKRLGEYQYVYNHTDHLGNIRVSYSKVNGVIKVLEENNYYPGGLKHADYNQTKNKLSRKITNDQKQITPTLENSYKYKYNSAEYQDEFDLNSYDLGARMYDPAIWRMPTIDPRADEYDYQSPYAFASNNPVYYVDINGEGVEDDYGIDKNGNVNLIKKTDDKFDRLFKAKSDANGNAIVDSNGNAQRATEGNTEGVNGDFVKVDKNDKTDSTIISDLSSQSISNSDGTKTNYANTSSIKDAAKVFLFSAINSDVEFGIGQQRNGGGFTVLTSHETNKIVRNKSIGLFKRYAHSHRDQERPSGFAGDPKKRGDIYGSGVGRFPRGIYYVPNQTYIPYDKSGSISKPKSARTLGSFIKRYKSLKRRNR